MNNSAQQEQLHIRVPAEMRTAIIAKSDRLGVPVNVVVRLALANYLGWTETQEVPDGNRS